MIVLQQQNLPWVQELAGSGNYRRLPKACLKIEYRPNVSGVVANLELEERLGAKPTAWGKAPSRSCAGMGIRGRSPLKLNAFSCFWISQVKFHWRFRCCRITQSRIIGRNFCPFDGTHSHGVEGNIYISENLQGSCHKVSKSNLKMDKISKN